VFQIWHINRRKRCSELETLRSESQDAQNESATAASQTAAIMSLNLKLQSAATRNQARNIDHELKRIEANESKEMLNIVQVMSIDIRVHASLTANRELQPYLPQVYIETDADATRCYLFFQRMASKTDLINIVTAQAHNIPESLNGSVSETLVGVCEVAFDLTISIIMWSFTMRLDEGCDRGALDALQTFRGHPSLL
jgi:dynactin 1